MNFFKLLQSRDPSNEINDVPNFASMARPFRLPVEHVGLKRLGCNVTFISPDVERANGLGRMHVRPCFPLLTNKLLLREHVELTIRPVYHVLLMGERFIFWYKIVCERPVNNEILRGLAVSINGSKVWGGFLGTIYFALTHLTHIFIV